MIDFPPQAPKSDGEAPTNLDANDPTRSLRATFRGIGSVIGPTSAVTALLYYFGWTRTNVQAHLMGLDDSLLGYSTQDYLLRSMSSMFGPLVVGLLAALAALVVHAGIISWVHRSGGFGGPQNVDPRFLRLLRRLVIGLALSGALLLVIGFVGVQTTDPGPVVYVGSPACVTVSIVIGVYAASLYRRFLTEGHRREPARELGGLRGLSATLIILLLVLSVFWNVSHYAAMKGRNMAKTAERLLPKQPTVVIFSAKRLYLQPPIVETALDPHDAAYQYAYTGLKFLFRSDHKYFLRPSDKGSQDNIVIPDGLDIRVEFFRGQ